MRNLSTIIFMGLALVAFPHLKMEARGGGGRRGEAHGGRPEEGYNRGLSRPLQRTPALSRAALYSGAAELGAAEGYSGGNGQEPVYIEENPNSPNQ